MPLPTITLRHGVVILAICGALAACSDTIPEPLAPSIATSPVGPALSVARVETDSPISAAERAAAEQLARSLALALNTADARQEVKTALVTSAVRERKLHFATYLQGRGGRLVAAMARNGGLSAGGLQAAVAAVRDLEFYMPVGAHRLAWTGDTPIAVGVQLDESEAPIMYTPRGERLVGRLDMPPANPVLMIVPSEANFASQDDLNLHGRAARICVIGTTDAVEAAARRCDATNVAAAPKPLASSVPSLAVADDPRVLGLFGTFFRVMDAHEPWTRGDPELELHVTGRRAGATAKAIDYQCAGEHANEPLQSMQPGMFSQSYVYDQNGNFWNGSVLIASPKQLDTLQSNAINGFNVSIWEDDNVACQINQKTTADYFKNIINATAAIVKGYVAITTVQKVPTGGTTRDYTTAAGSFGTAVSELYDLFRGGDDFVGVLVMRDSTPYWNQYPGNTHIIYDGTTFNGRATLVVRTSDATGATPGVVASIDVTPTGDTVAVGSGRQYTAYAYDGNGVSVPDAVFTWSTSNGAVASVTSNGFVTGNSSGSITVTASAGGVVGSAPAAVIPMPPFSALSVDGVTSTQAYLEEEYSAVTTGGTEPFTYQWKVDGIVRGGNNPYLLWKNNGRSYTVSLTVTDALGVVKTASIRTIVDTGCGGLKAC